MIKSMTGFGAGDSENQSFKVHVEIKTVNQRFLETNFRMPHCLAMYESNIVKKIKEYASRGKMDISVKFWDLRDKEAVINVDMGLAKAYGKALHDIKHELGLLAPITPAEIAGYQDVLRVEEAQQNLDEAEPVIMEAFDMALKNLVAMREAEGANIQVDLLKRIEILEGFVEQLAVLAPEIVANYRQRLEKVLNEYLNTQEIDEARIIQETALYTDKVNYTEEIVRLRSHFAQFREIISADEPVGRKIDFLIQKMNREINTVASKANSAGAAQIVVDVKSEIEKIREQIQNIE